MRGGGREVARGRYRRKEKGPELLLNRGPIFKKNLRLFYDNFMNSARFTTILRQIYDSTNFQKFL